MLYIASLLHQAREDAESLSEVEVYVMEMAPASYAQDLESPQSLQPSASDHIRFAVQEVLEELDKLKKEQPASG
jgi:hypothetical protein